MNAAIHHAKRTSANLECILSAILLLTPPAISAARAPHHTAEETSESVATLRISTRLVTLEVVVKNRHGHHVENLKASDFQVFEQTPSRGGKKREQKIAAFNEVRVADLAGNAATQARLPDGWYTNRITLQKEPVPLTILLVDGLNTRLSDQAQVHVQMLKMLQSLPSNVPTAVFLLGDRLQMLQGFTTDPSLLKAALASAISPAVKETMRLPPDINPDALSAQFASFNGGPRGAHAPAGLIAAVGHFENVVYGANLDMRVHATLEALTSLALGVAGYPGRKNLLWISTAFPISFGGGRGTHYLLLKRCSEALNQAKVAVYPISPAGVAPPEIFDAGSRVRPDVPLDTQEQVERGLHEAEHATMQALAERTGGRVCSDNNDLGDCVRRAIDDSSSYYEIAYYSNSPYWNGEYRRIIVNVKKSGLHLEYRRGYFARRGGEKTAKQQQAELQQAACEDYMNATGIFMAARPLSRNSQENLKFYLMVNPTGLTITPTTDGNRELNVVVGACTFDKKGWPVKLMSENIHRELNAKEYESLMTDGLRHIVEVPGEKAVVVRLFVKDVPSGQLGSVNIRLKGPSAVPPPAAGGSATQTPRPH